MYIPTRYIDTVEVERAVDAFIKTLGPEVVRVRYNIGEDWTGDPALYLRIILADSVASNRDTLFKAAQRVRLAFREQLRPQELWGLFPHTSFRSKSEQDQLNDPKWQ